MLWSVTSLGCTIVKRVLLGPWKQSAVFGPTLVISEGPASLIPVPVETRVVTVASVNGLSGERDTCLIAPEFCSKLFSQTNIEPYSPPYPSANTIPRSCEKRALAPFPSLEIQGKGAASPANVLVCMTTPVLGSLEPPSVLQAPGQEQRGGGEPVPGRQKWNKGQMIGCCLPPGQ